MGRKLASTVAMTRRAARKEPEPSGGGGNIFEEVMKNILQQAGAFLFDLAADEFRSWREKRRTRSKRRRK
jgi:hypothetical protein